MAFFLGKKPVKQSNVENDSNAVFIIPSNEWKSEHVVMQDQFLYIRRTTEQTLEVAFRKDKDIFSLFRTRQQEAAEDMFHTLTAPISAIFKSGTFRSQTTIGTCLAQLVALSSTIMKDRWTVAHVCAFIGQNDIFSIKNPEALGLINEQCSNSLLTPLHIAIIKEHVATVKAMLSHKVSLNLVDIDGNTPLHYAAISTKDIAILVSRESAAKQYLNMENKNGCTPLLLACYADRIENVKELLRTSPMSMLFPPWYFKTDWHSTNSTQLQEKYFPKVLIDDLDPEDIKYGGTPLHWVKSRDSLEKAMALGFDINARNANGESALHVSVKHQRVECLILLLCANINTECKGFRGATALQYAVALSDLTAVQALLVFDANVNCSTENCLSARHMAAKLTEADDDLILFCLYTAGAERCPASKIGCTNGCSHEGTYNGRLLRFIDEDPMDEWFMKYNGVCVQKRMSQSVAEQKDSIRLITFDGGGIKGLVTVQMLIEIEKKLKHPLSCYFNWFAGTSTGAIIASLLCKDFTLRQVRTIYLTLKDKVIQGTKPYDSKKLEAILKHYLGKDTRTVDIQHANLSITAALADRHPAELYLYRSYLSPAELLDLKTHDENLYVPPPSSAHKLWEACRASGAAPTYFRAFGPFIDGGLVANNPTLDILAEISIYRDIQKSLGQTDILPEIDFVLSMGSGKVPITARPVVDFGNLMSMNPTELYKNALTAKGLINLLIAQATQADGHVVHRCKAWCRSAEVPFYRLTPCLTDQIAIDEANEPDLISALWQAKAYIHQNVADIQALISLLERESNAARRDQERKARISNNSVQIDVIRDIVEQIFQ